MILQVDLTATPAGVSLESAQDCGRFHVSVTGSRDPVRLGAALSLAGVGRALDDDHVWVQVDAVRSLAAPRVEPGWEESFAGMLTYAASKGWLDEAGDAIQAHIEWPASG